MDLFASRETSHCPLWFSLTLPAPLGLDVMVQTWPRHRLYAFTPIALLPGVLERVRRDWVLLLLIASRWPGRVWFPDLISLYRRASSGAPRQEGSSVPSRGLDISPPTRTVETVGLASEGAQLIESGLSNEVVETILYSRAPSTRKLYALKWKVYTSWCSDHQLDRVNYPVSAVLEFLQDWFTAGLAPSTLKVYVAAISAYHIPLGGMSLGKDPLVSRFLRGTLRLRCCKPSVLLLSECGQGKAQFALPNVGIRCLHPQSCPVALNEQLFVCFGPPNKGSPATKQRMSKWVVEAISLAYESVGQPSPMAVRSHLARSMAASKALIPGVALQEVCDAAGWSSPQTFIRLYSLDLDSTPGTPGSHPSAAH